MVSCQFGLKANPIAEPTPTSYLITETSTFTPASLSTSTATPDLTATAKSLNDSQELTKEASFTNPCQELSHPYISASGKWAVYKCGQLTTQRFVFVNNEDKKWTINYSDYFAESELDNDYGEFGELNYFYWANDDSGLYFETHIGFDGGGICYYGFYSRGLYRLNLSDGTITPVITASKLGSVFYYSFSPDMTKIAYSTDKVILLDLITGKETFVSEVSTKDTSISSVIWSPDGTQFAYTTCEFNEETVKPYKSTLELYSISSKNVKNINEVFGKEISIYESLEDNYLTICASECNNSFNWLTGSLQEIPSQ